jgi:hypothetical protein
VGRQPPVIAPVGTLGSLGNGCDTGVPGRRNVGPGASPPAAGGPDVGRAGPGTAGGGVAAFDPHWSQ